MTEKHLSSFTIKMVFKFRTDSAYVMMIIIFKSLANIKCIYFEIAFKYLNNNLMNVIMAVIICILLNS